MNTFSYWEHQGFGKADWVILGAGLVGLQSARKIKDAFPQKRVMVLDAHALGNAASLRNAGFACFGSAGEMLDEIERTSESEALALYEKRYLGIAASLKRYGADALGYEPSGGIEVFSHNKKDDFDCVTPKLDYLNALIRSVHTENAFRLCSLESSRMHVLPQGIASELEGSLLAHKFYHSVRCDALASGVEIYEGMRVLEIEEGVNIVKLRLENGMMVNAEQMLLCTNGFTRHLFPEMKVAPARGQVFVTQALNHQPLNGIYHADKGYIYFRELGNRILIGGGRNTAFDEEETTQMLVSEKLKQYLTDYMYEVVLPGQKVNFEYAWAGIMGMDQNRNPIIEKKSERMFVAVRMGGMGVALSAWVSDRVLDLVKEAHTNL